MSTTYEIVKFAKPTKKELLAVDTSLMHMILFVYKMKMVMIPDGAFIYFGQMINL